MERKPEHGTPFHTRQLDLGRCRLPDLDSIAETLAIAEREDYR